MEERNEQRKDTLFRVKEGKEHDIFISESIHDETQFFYSEYQLALSALKGILNRRLKLHQDSLNHEYEQEFWRKGWRTGSKCFQPYESIFYGYSNNIIAFCAGRGQGKTSAMLSFTKALSKSGEKSGEREPLINEEPFYSKPPRFLVLPAIDPTILEDKDTIMEVILSYLFVLTEKSRTDHSLKEERKKRTERNAFLMLDEESERESRAEIMRKFRKCIDHIQSLRSGGKSRYEEEDPLEALYRLGDSLDLKSEFYYLLEQVFHETGYDPQNSFLVVQLDDTDLQMKKAYDVLEDTRKYLCLPNVIVVMAADLEQLRLLMIQHYYDELSIAVKRGEIGGKEIHRMASMYLDKMIPAANTIYLPTLGLKNKRADMRLKIERAMKEESDTHDFQQAIFDLIYRKTGVVFIRHKKFIHNIVPENLRNYEFLYRLLNSMQEPPEAPELKTPEDNKLLLSDWRRYCQERLERAERLLSNLRVFEGYFLNEWCSDCLDKSDWEIIRLIDTGPIHLAIRHVMRLLKKRERPQTASNAETKPLVAGEWKLSGNSEVTTARGATHTNTHDFTIRPLKETDVSPTPRYVELQQALDDLKHRANRQEDYALMFAIRAYFTIELNIQALLQQKRDLEAELDAIKAVSSYTRRQIHERGDNPGESEYRSPHDILVFDYSYMQDILFPHVFDAETLQEGMENAFREIQKQAAKRDKEDIWEKIPYYFRASKDVRQTREDMTQSAFAGGISTEGDCPCDLLRFFYNALNIFRINQESAVQNAEPPFETYTPEMQRRMLNMQDLAVLVSCNWDVQDQIAKSLSSRYRILDYQRHMEGKPLELQRGLITQEEAEKAYPGNQQESLNIYGKQYTKPGHYINAFFAYCFQSLDNRDNKGGEAPLFLENYKKLWREYGFIQNYLFPYPESGVEGHFSLFTAESGL
ncbi:MAG: hypothetical protein IJK52_11285 [Oscillospiraceae bacterium]|nr:hypothetical protein [Oscillospiraceae bacterium]